MTALIGASEPYEDEPLLRKDYEIGYGVLAPDGAFGGLDSPTIDDCVIAHDMWMQYSGEPVDTEAFIAGCRAFVDGE